MTDKLCSEKEERGDVSVYKFGEEEVSVEKGIVKKQKLGKKTTNLVFKIN